jgi:integrase
MGRRVKGEGNIWWNDKQGRWEGRLDLGPGPDGRRRRPKRTGATRAEVAEKLRSLRAEVDQGVDVARTVTVGELLDGYLASKAALQASTVARYTSLIDNHLRPSLGRVAARELRPGQIEEQLSSMADKGYSRDTIVDVRRLLKDTCDWGLRRRLISWNPASVAEMPHHAKRDKQKRRPLPADAAARFLSAARKERLGPMLAVMAITGMRPGEATLLEVGDVDLEEATVRVQRAMKGGSHRSRAPGETKTAAGRRDLRIPPLLVDMLRRHRATLATERLAVGRHWPTEWRKLLFVSDRGTPVDPANLRRVTRRVALAAGLDAKVRPYELRHTATSLLADQGLTNEEIADMLGHASTRTLDTTYRRRTTAVEAATRLDGLLSEGAL